MDGTLVIPQFVLKELQLVADSSDSMKRNRGRRGLDILQKIQKMSGVDVTISDMDFPDVREVDLKLIELARTLQGKIVTNDFNLNKVAQLRGVEVLNINELANSLKPVVLPGEIMKVFILKEGKEYNQGVAYLDDGTMVVVDNARKMIGKTIDVVVTSVLQTTAGKMIFGRFIESRCAAGADGQRRVHRRRRQPPSAAAGAAVSRGCGQASQNSECRIQNRCTLHLHDDSSVSLVADGLLPDPCHRACTRSCSARCRSRRASFEKQRLLRALVRAHLVAADPRDDRRARRRSTASSGSSLAGTYVFVVESPEHLRHSDPVLVAAVSAAHHRQGVARQLSVPRLAPAAHRPHARRPPAPRSRARSSAGRRA